MPKGNPSGYFKPKGGKRKTPSFRKKSSAGHSGSSTGGRMKFGRKR